jgi:hypothetical protein
MTGLPVVALMLAFAPGGLAEMSLIAIAIGADAAFVATHHVVRIFLIVVLAPLAFRFVKRGRGLGTEDATSRPGSQRRDGRDRH